jgi:hypothetical protein
MKLIGLFSIGILFIGMVDSILPSHQLTINSNKYLVQVNISCGYIRSPVRLKNDGEPMGQRKLIKALSFVLILTVFLTRMS